MESRGFSLYPIIVLVCLCLYFVPTSTRADNSSPQGNDNYIVLVEEGNTLAIYDIERQVVLRKKLKFRIEHLEVCPSYPFVSFTSCSKKSVKGDKEYFIYDLKYDKLYSGKFYLDNLEHRWPPGGEYTYINNQTSFVLVPTRYLRDFLKSPSKTDKLIEIKGHPLGYIWQVTWIGHNIIYCSGEPEMECWGFFDTGKEKNYFISCCGMPGNNRFSRPCNKVTRESISIAELLISQIEKQEIREISKDFYSEVQRIIRQEKSETIP